MDHKEEQLRQRAYDIWQAEGEPHGRDREHWDMAQRELATPDVEAPTAKPAAPRRKKAASVDPTEVPDVVAAKPKARKPRAVKPA